VTRGLEKDGVPGKCRKDVMEFCKNLNAKEAICWHVFREVFPSFYRVCL